MAAVEFEHDMRIIAGLRHGVGNNPSQTSMPPRRASHYRTRRGDFFEVSFYGVTRDGLCQCCN